MDPTSLYRISCNVGGEIRESYLLVPLNGDILDYIKREVDAYDILVSIEQVHKCEGCRYDAPGQLAHMEGPHGCLYLGD